MTATDWNQYRDLIIGEPMPAIHERFNGLAPQCEGMRLFAGNGGTYHTAQIRGETVCLGSQPVDHGVEVVVEYDAEEQQEAAQRVRYWLKQVGYRLVHAIHNPVDVGGES